eukprot:COSAG06_NODE_29317_length_558_cov_8.858388_1_plen_151_part_01
MNGTRKVGQVFRYLICFRTCSSISATNPGGGTMRGRYVQAAPVAPLAVQAVERRRCLNEFSLCYICPEPVLVKRSCLNVKSGRPKRTKACCLLWSPCFLLFAYLGKRSEGCFFELHLVLTGDKEETAINIGKSCNLLDSSMDIHVIRGEKN